MLVWPSLSFCVLAGSRVKCISSCRRPAVFQRYPGLCSLVLLYSTCSRAPEIITRRFPSSCIEIGVIAFLLQALVSPYLVVRTRVLRGTAHWHLATRVLAPCAHLSPLLLLYLPLHKQLSKLLSLFTAYVSFSAIKCH